MGHIFPADVINITNGQTMFNVFCLFVGFGVFLIPTVKRYIVPLTRLVDLNDP